MMNWIENYAKTHLFYIILIVGGVIGFRSWLAEHDQRLASDAAVKQNQVIVADLRQQIAARDAAAAIQKATVVKITQAAKTPEQIVQAIPQLTDVPLNTRIVPGLQPTEVAVQAPALLQLVSDLKTTSIDLATCQGDLADEKKIAATDEDTIKELRKKPKFWARVKSHGKAGIVGAVILEGVRIWLTKRP